MMALGGDSAVELVSAVVVLWWFHPSAAKEDAERRAARIAGVLLVCARSMCRRHCRHGIATSELTR
jgi:hypothetical protein